MSITTREQAIEFLYGRIDYERMSASLSASDFKLDRMRNLLQQIGNPQTHIPVVHIAGTKGKGSTATMIASILKAAGYRVGLFTSPHLEQFEERVRVDGAMIDESGLIELVEQLSHATHQIDAATDGLNPTFFELTTALAWLYFRREQVDIAVLEVGLGGRLDSTNVCQPEVCVLTTISRDHMHILGSRLADIAAEKAGVIKPGIPVVSGVESVEADRVIRQVASQQDAPLTYVDDDSASSLVDQWAQTAGGSETTDRASVMLSGKHQRRNAAIAVCAAKVLRQRGWRLGDEAIHAGLALAHCPVRVEVVGRSPLVVLDAAHNWASAGALLESIQEFDVPGRRVLIFATSRDKDVSGLLRRLTGGFDSVVLTQFQSNPRAMPLAQLQVVAARVNTLPTHAAATPADAWNAARKICPEDGLICVAGSFFLAAELREVGMMS